MSLKRHTKKLLYRVKRSGEGSEVNSSPTHGNTCKQAAIGLEAPELLPGLRIQSIKMPRAFPCRKLVITDSEVDNAISHNWISQRGVFCFESPQQRTGLGVERVEELVFVSGKDRSSRDGRG